MTVVQPRTRAVGIVLAAGAGRRFGGDKVLAALNGRPLVAHVLAAARAGGIVDLVVVAGKDPAPLREAIGDEAVVVANVLAHVGQATSVQRGLEAAERSLASVAALLLGDEPGIDPDVIRRVIDAGHDVPARAVYRDGPGHPVVLPRAYWEEVAAGVWGDAGARTVLTHLHVRDVNIDAPRPLDVDRPCDLQAAAEPLASPHDD
ncbi:MAG: nucleotidyltransferase family protein [Nitriliruptoraceae bacterium]